MSRTQRVLFKNCLSDAISVTSGVPQGSHLGPLLFVLYLNDLPTVVKFSKILMYADDVKLFVSLRNVDDSYILQDDLNRLSVWCNVNSMSLNFKKCKKLSFNRSVLKSTSYFIGANKLENVLSFLDLGVLLDHRLRFHLHIEACVNKAKSLLGFMKRWSKEFMDPYITKSLFMSLVRPTLEYASVIWSPHYQCYIDRIESVQKQFLLFALRGLGWDTNINLPRYESRLMLIDLPSLHNRRIMLSITFMVKLINGDIDSRFLLSQINFTIPNRFTRNYKPLKLSFCRANYEIFNPLRSICKNYNDFFNTFSISDSIYIIKRFLLKELQSRVAN